MRRPFVLAPAGLLGVSLAFSFLIGGCPPGSTLNSGSSAYNLPPRVVLSVNPDPPRGVAPLKIQLDSSGSSDDGVIVDRLWNFGDGTTSREITPTHEYSRNGTFIVSLTLTDDNGATNSASVTVVVSEAPIAQFTVAYVPAPDAAVVPGQTSAEISPATFEFDASASTDPDAAAGDKLTYLWDFGDGTTVSVPTLRHTFSRAGTYRVTLAVTDATGIKTTVEQFITVGIQQPVIAFRSPPAEISELIVSRTSPLWTYVNFLVEPGVPYTIRAGLDTDRDPNNAGDILLDTNAFDGVLVEDLPLTIPTALDLNTTPAIPLGSYNLFAELRTDRTRPVRTYANAKITLINTLPASTGTAPLVPFTVDTDGSERARVLVPKATLAQRRFIFDLGNLNRGDRLSLALLTTPGYTEVHDVTGFRMTVLDDAQHVFGIWDADPDNPILFTRDSTYPVARTTGHMFVAIDAPPPTNLQVLVPTLLLPPSSVSVRVERAVLPPTYIPPRQRIYLNFDGTNGNPVAVSPGQEQFVVPAFAPQAPRVRAAIIAEVQARVTAVLAPYLIDVSTTPPAAPYTQVLFDTSGALSPGVFVDVPELAMYGRPDVLDPRNSTLTGLAAIAANRLEDELGAGLNDVQFADALANAALHQIGLMCGLRETTAPATDIMSNNRLSVAGAVSFAVDGTVDYRDTSQVPLGAVGVQDAPQILGEVFGTP